VSTFELRTGWCLLVFQCTPCHCHTGNHTTQAITQEHS
jgi:hypothetical protein